MRRSRACVESGTRRMCKACHGSGHNWDAPSYTLVFGTMGRPLPVPCGHW